MHSVFTFPEEQERSMKLANLISIAIMGLCLMIGIAYKLSGVTANLEYKIWAVTFVFLIPILLNRAGHINWSRSLLSVVLPIIIIFLSISSKQGALDARIINPVNYFDIRIALLNAAIIPLVLFNLSEWKWLLLALSPTLVALLLFDPIHNAMGVGYYQVGIESPDYYLSANLFTAITLIFFILIFLFLKKQIQESEQKQTQENMKIRVYLSELVELSNSPNITNGKVDEAKKEILKAAFHCLGVSRVSIWNFNRSEESITCEYLFEKNKITSPYITLFAKDYPSYFLELKYQQLIIAQDARENPKTAEFKESYLEPLNIYSLMDAPFLRKRDLGGVICCEHQHKYKNWGAAESLVLKALGDFLSYALIVEERMKQSVLLEEQNQEILSMNDNLESMVKHRTEELEEKNKQLTEYAYINAHILRAPVARISGLYQLLASEIQENMNDVDILNYMEASIEELNQVTQKINKAIEENGIINRRHLSK